MAFKAKGFSLALAEQTQRDVQAGVVVAAFTVVLALSFGSLIFSGGLALASAQGVLIALITAVAGGLVVTWRSSYSAVMAIPQDRTAPILAVMAAEIAAALPTAMGVDEKARVVMAAIAITSLGTGLVLYLVGRFRLGNLFRFIPYPVIGGFLAGSGWMLARGSFRVMADFQLGLDTIGRLLEWGVISKSLPGVAFGTALFLTIRKLRKPALMPVLLIAVVVAFYLVLLATGTSVESARSAGWLPVPPGEGGIHGEMWSPRMINLLGATPLLKVAGIAGTVLLTALISILLNASGLELVVHEEIDINRELRAAGICNLVSGVAGGMPGFHSLSLSRLAFDLGARTRLAGMVAAGLCLVALLAGPSSLAFLPKFVPGGLLFYLGLGFLFDWAYAAWSRLPKADYAVVILILCVIGGAGYLVGVAFGILAAVFLFIHNYSQVGVMTRTHNGTDRQSNVERPIAHQRVLRDHGAETQVLRLHGFIFFGTSARVLDQIRRLATDTQLPRLRFFVLDFRHVSGIDSSATLSLARARQLAEKQGFKLCFSQVPPDVRRQLSRAGFDTDAGEAFRFFPDLDHAHEWCEQQTLSVHRDEIEDKLDIRSQLEAIWSKPTCVAKLMTYLERITIEPGMYLIRQGDAADALYFLESGEVTTLLELGNGQTQRLRRQAGGTVLGELGLFLGVPRTASVVVELPSVAYRLSASSLAEMKRVDPDVAREFYEFLVRYMAERIVNCNRTIRALAE
jgi:SulP family sulfate permease